MCAHASRTRRSNGSLAERPLLSWPLLDRRQRVSQLPALAMLIAWFAYTRLYFFLHPHGLTFDPSLFMYLTGKPDPTCGLTRTFAWTWRGDLGQAVRVYPLGPLAFARSGRGRLSGDLRVDGTPARPRSATAGLVSGNRRRADRSGRELDREAGLAGYVGAIL